MIFFTELQQGIYKEYYRNKLAGAKNFATATAQMFGVTRAYVQEIVKNIDEFKPLPPSAVEKAVRNEILDLKWQSQFKKRLGKTNPKAQRKNNRAVQDFAFLVGDMLLAGFSISEIARYTGHKQKLVEYYASKIDL